MKTNQARVAWALMWCLLAVVYLLCAWYIGLDFMAGPEEGIVPTLLVVLLYLLLGYCFGLALLAFEQKKRQGGFSARVGALLFWTPRILTLVFTAFISLFSFDVFEGPGSIWLKLGGFLIHSIPALVMLLGSIYAWRHEWLGALVFMGWGVFYVMSFRGFILAVYFQLGVLPFSLGLLYLLNWLYRADVRLARGG